MSARVLVAMSGGVDSSVAAALLLEAGHDVTGVTMKLWGGESDTGCCSVSDVDDARRVADQLGIDHHVFNFGDEFTRRVVDPYVEAHAVGRTPNPCIECNRHLKFDSLLRRARVLGFDAVATGHHARLVEWPSGSLDGGRVAARAACSDSGPASGSPPRAVARGADPAKDQSYVLYMLDQEALSQLLLPVGSLTKHQVRAEAHRLGLRTADKPDSQDVCFITRVGGRGRFLGDRIPLRPGRLVDPSGSDVGEVAAVELVTVGQRRGLGPAPDGRPRYALDVDVAASTVVVGPAELLDVAETLVDDVVWPAARSGGRVEVQCSAHGEPGWASVELLSAPGTSPEHLRVVWEVPHRRVAPGQSVVFYDGDRVIGGGIAR